jgi:ATP-binding cassette, subfamily B, multidrug efflux pump
MKQETATPRASMASLRIVLEFWRERKGWAVLLVLGMLVATGLTLAFPYILRLIIDGIKRGVTQAQLIRYVLLLVGFGVMRVVGDVVMPFARGRINELYAWKVRTEVFRRVLHMGHTFSAKFPTGDVMERLDHDMNELSFFACSVIFRFIGSIFMVVFSLAIMLRMNALLTVISVLPAGLALWGWLRLGPQMYALFMKWRQKISEVNNQLESAFTGIRLVKSYVMENKLASRFRNTLDERVDVAVSEARLEAKIDVFYTGIAEIATLLVLWVGGVQVVGKHLTLGQFVAFNAYILMLLGPMFDIGRLFISGRRAQGTAERIQALKSHPTEVGEPVLPRQPVPGELRLENVTFCYSDRPALRNVSMVFTPGSKVGIAGTVGSGKSSIFRLLFRMADPQAGRVLLDGVDIRELDLDAYRRLFGYAPQEATLFSDTVRGNIAFGRDVSGEQLRRAVDAAQFSRDAAELPKGLDETLGEKGTRLSGGQKERVAIARAIATRPPVMVFDDATSALDAETERDLINRLVTELAGTTTIIVSHRLSVLSTCDHVYVLDGGEVREEGRHAELLERKGLYWKLYQRQLISEELEKL